MWSKIRDSIIALTGKLDENTIYSLQRMTTLNMGGGLDNLALLKQRVDKGFDPLREKQAARDAATALYFIVAQGIGGTLVVNGETLTGAHGAAGEYGHIPFGDPTLVCPCGARGCWDLTVDGRALARHRGDEPPDDPVAYVHHLLGKRDAPTRRAFEAVAASLGRGAGALVNLHDPEVVTLGGVAAALRSAAMDVFNDAYRDALMAFRKDSPPPVRDAEHGEDGPLHGAVALALDHVTTTAGLADWVDRQRV